MGRHSSAKARRRFPVVPLVTVVVLGLLGWLGYDFVKDRLGTASCDTTTVINVTAAPDIASVITGIGAEVSEQDGCYKVNVASRDSAATAESLVVSDGMEQPDVWIPESTIWLRRAHAKGAWEEPADGTSLASSPVVLALTEDAAGRLGWPAKQPTWAEGLDLKVGLPDPGLDPAGVSALLAVHGLVDSPAQVTTKLRELSANTEPEPDDLFDRLPGTTDDDGPIDGFPVAEHEVLLHNARGDGSQLVASYADPAVPSLDYPFVVLPETPAAEREAAGEFLDRLQSQASSEVLADAGFRTPDGEMLRERADDQRTSPDKMTPAELPTDDELDQLLNEWSGVNLSGRVQVLLDVSGSMNEPVPGTDHNRMAVTLQAAELGIGLMKPTTKLGIWLFSTNLDGEGKDFRELWPVLPIRDHKANDAMAELRDVKALPNGATGLYDSTLAAYQSATQAFEPGRINTVVVMTDGRNDDENSISRDQLLAELQKLQDPQRPVRIVGIGIGPDIDVGELQAIAGATGGKAFTTPDPTKIGGVFYEALSLLLCQPPECDPAAGN